MIKEILAAVKADIEAEWGGEGGEYPMINVVDDKYAPILDSSKTHNLTIYLSPNGRMTELEAVDLKSQNYSMDVVVVKTINSDPEAIDMCSLVEEIDDWLLHQEFAGFDVNATEINPLFDFELLQKDFFVGMIIFNLEGSKEL